MKVIILVIFVVLGFASNGISETEGHMGSREERELAMAENAILTSLMVAQNQASRYMCSQNAYACVGPDRSELALALIASRNSSNSLNSLANLVRFRIDGGLSEDFVCYTLDKGKNIAKYLKKLNPKMLEKRCRTELSEVTRRNKGLFTETTLEVCAEPATIKERVRDLLESLRTSERCSAEDF